jgi:hypothetical protein
MSWTDWAQLAVSAYGAYSGNKASKDAGKQAQQGAQASNDLMKWMYEQDQKRQQPFYNTSVSADSRLAQLLGLGGGGAATGAAANSTYYDIGPDGTPIARADMANDPRYMSAWNNLLKQHQGQWKTGYHSGSDRNWIQGNLTSALGAMQQPAQPNQQQSQQAAFDAFRNTPGYQFGLDEGRKTLESSAAAAGGLNSGATLRALTRYAQGYADQQGYRPYVSDLMQLSGRGQAQASQMGNQGMQYASQMGQNLQNAANARAQSTYQQQQNLQQGLGALSGWLGYYGGNRNAGGNQRVTGADAFGYGYGG